MRRDVRLSAVLCLAAGVLTSAQNVPPPVFRAGVDVVQADVSVLDKNRRPVRGLTAADFSVIEEGKPRPIVAFAAVDLPDAPAPIPGAASWIRDVPADEATNAVASEGRLAVIAFDWTVRFSDLPIARRIATAIVDGLGPQDLGGVIFTNSFSDGGIRQNLTPEKARLLDAIARPITTAAVDADGELIDMMPPPVGDPVIDTPSCRCGLCSYDILEAVADAIALVPGRRKTVFFISTYFPPPLVPPGWGCSEHIRLAREAITRKLAVANATVHVLDPSGSEPLQLNVGTGRGYGGGALQNTGWLRQRELPFLANLTGGRMVMNDNTPEVVVPAILDESRSYYLLAFPQAGRTKAKDGLNRFQVKVNRRDVTVQSRTAYVVGDTAASREAAARKMPLADAIGQSLPRTDEPLSLTATPVQAPNERLGSVAVVLRTEPAPDAAARTDGSGSDRADVVIVAVDPEGKVVSSVTRTATMPWAPGSGRPPAYEMLARLDLKPGRYEVRAASDVRGRSRSSVYGFVEVPDFTAEALAVSGIVFEALPGSMAAPRDAFADLLPIVPTARRRFDATDQVTVFARIYRKANVPAPTVLTRVVDAVGKVVFEERRETAEPDEQWGLPIDRLAAGEYLLTIEATSAGHSATQRARFNVR